MDTSYIGDSLESNMQHTQKKPVLHSIPNEHHMHHASLPSMEVASDTHPLHSMKSADDLQAAHQMHDMNSMQTVYDMQTAHNMHKMHEGHAMSMNGSHSMDHFGSKFSNATEMSHGNHHDMSGHNMEHMAHGSMEHMSHGGMGHEGAHSNMSMTFHGGVIETILFSWWHVDNVPEFIGSFIAVFTVALLYEGLKYYRKHLLWKTYSGLRYCAVAPPDKGISNICTTDEPQVIQPTMLSNSHVWQTFLHGVQVLVSYLLMLIFMTYNTWLCSAVVLGSATGYFLFGWRESVVVDFTEHCH